MIRTIQELREERGESRTDLAAALGVTLDEVTAWELGRAKPTLSRLRILTEHFGVRDDQINLEPHRRPSLGEQLRDGSSRSTPRSAAVRTVGRYRGVPAAYDAKPRQFPWPAPGRLTASAGESRSPRRSCGETTQAAPSRSPGPLSTIR